MASKSSRQRKLERVRAERRLARQAERQRRKRQTQAGIGVVLAVLLITLGVVYFAGGFDGKQTPTVASGTCTWTLKDPKTNPNVIDTGNPPTSGELRDGVEDMTITTNAGVITARIDLTKAPCTAASFAYLGEKNYFNGSTCHRLNTEAKTLTCGDPKSDGSGEPSYQFADEDLPTTALVDPSAPATPSTAPSASASSPPVTTYYAKGTIVMVNTGAGTNGSQFSIVYGDGSNLSPAYSIVGVITSGLDVVEKIAAAGANKDGKPATEGKPNTNLTIEQLSVGSTPPSASASAPASASATPSAPQS